MNKFASILLAAAATVAVASPALANSGSVDVTGTVGARCTAVTPISGSITLGELAKADGTVDAAFAGNTGGLTRSFTVICNSANPKLSVNALPMVNSAAATPPAGYTNTVHYTATLSAMQAKGGTGSVVDQSIATGATTGNVERIAAVANNLSVTVGTGVTTESTAVLASGSYAGKVEIVVSPTT